MKKILIIVLLAYLSPCIAQEFRGGEFHFTRINQHQYDTDIDLYYQKPNIPNKNFILVDASTGIQDTAFLVANDSVSSDVQRLRYHASILLPFGSGTYIIRVIDTIFLPELVNLDGTHKDIFSLHAFLRPPDNQFFGLNSPPVFIKPPTDYYFDNGKLIFNSGAEDRDGDSLFYELIDLNYPDFYNYSWPACSDTFFLNPLNGILTWDKPLYPGKYLIGVAVSEYYSGANYFGQMGRYFIIEITEADIVSAQDPKDASPFRISPNPASDAVFINDLQNEGRFEILDFRGIVVQSGNLSVGATSVYISSLTNGMYIIRIFSDGKVWTEKLMVQR